MLTGAQKQVALDQFLLTGERRFLEPIVPLRERAQHWIQEAARLSMEEKDRGLVASLSAGHDHLAVVAGAEHGGEHAHFLDHAAGAAGFDEVAHLEGAEQNQHHP